MARFWEKKKIQPSDSSKDISKKNSSDLYTKEIFDFLKTRSDDQAYQEALKVIEGAPDEYFNAFTTIIQILHFTVQPSDPSAPAQVQPPARVMKPVNAFLLITGQTYQAHCQILDVLNAQGSRVTHTEDIQLCDVILLFCPILSRVRSDVEAAFRKIPDGAQGKPVVLVLLHHIRKPDHVLNQIQWKEQFPDIIQEVQVLYHETQNGLLQCPRNQEALQSLQSMWGDFQKKTDVKSQIGF